MPEIKFCFFSHVQGGGTPRCGRRGARARVEAPTRSLSSHHLSGSSLRPIGLSKSDDQILNRVSDSPEDEDCLEDYVEGQQAQDLARDLITLHLSAEEAKRNSLDCVHFRATSGEVIDSSCKNHNDKFLPLKLSARERLRRCHRIGASGRGLSVDGRIDGAYSGYCCANNHDAHHNEPSKTNDKHNMVERNRPHCSVNSGRASSILALHHPNVSSPRLLHHYSPQVQHYYNISSSNTSSPIVYGSNDSSPRVLHREMSSPRFSHSAASSPRVYHSNISQKLLHGKSASPRLPHSALSSPRLQHVTTSNTHSYSLVKNYSPAMSLHSTSTGVAGVLQGSYDSSIAASIQSTNSLSDSSKPYVDEPSTSGYLTSKMSSGGDVNKSSLRELERSEGLAKLKPLELHTPPGTAPLPVKFIKKTPLADRSPSSWFSPPRQKDLSLPIKRSCQSRSSSSDASTSERMEPRSRIKKIVNASNNSARSEDVKSNMKRGVFCLKSNGRHELSGCSQNSINSSMEVLIDTVSQSGLSLPTQGNAKTSSFSLDSMVSGGSSLESLKSSMSEGSKSMGEGAISGGTWRTMGSNTSLPLRPSLLLPASHRSLIQVHRDKHLVLC